MSRSWGIRSGHLRWGGVLQAIIVYVFRFKPVSSKDQQSISNLDESTLALETCCKTWPREKLTMANKPTSQNNSMVHGQWHTLVPTKPVFAYSGT